MQIDPADRGKRPLTRAAGPYGHPIHPLLITVPIGAWVAALVFDVAAQLVDRPRAFTVGARWLIGIGVLGAVIAAAFGLLDLLAIPRRTRAFWTGVIHMVLNLAVTAAFLISYFIRTGRAPTGAVSLGVMVISIVALATLGVSGWLGGRMTYRYGIRVADEGVQREGFEEQDSPIPRRRAA